MRLVIADDHPLFRMGLKYALIHQGFDVVAEAADGLAALDACLHFVRAQLGAEATDVMSPPERVSH